MIATTDDMGNEALRGGMMKRQMQQQQGITTYFDVKSVQEYSAKVERLGGKVIFPKRPVSGMGYTTTMYADTENNAFAIWETDNTAKYKKFVPDDRDALNVSPTKSNSYPRSHVKAIIDSRIAIAQLAD